MNAFLVALLFSLGAGTRVYTKLQQKTGYGNSKGALKGAATVAGISFVVFLMLGLTFL